MLKDNRMMSADTALLLVHMNKMGGGMAFLGPSPRVPLGVLAYNQGPFIFSHEAGHILGKPRIPNLAYFPYKIFKIFGSPALGPI